MCAVLCTVHCTLVLFWAHNEIFLEETIDSLHTAVHCSILQQISDLRWGERDSWWSLWELREVSWCIDFPCRCDPTMLCQEWSGIQHPLWQPVKHRKRHQYSLHRRLARIMFVKLYSCYVRRLLTQILITLHCWSHRKNGCPNLMQSNKYPIVLPV